MGKSAVNYEPSSWTAGAGHFQIKRKNIPAEVRWDNSTEEVQKTYARLPNNTTYSKFSDSQRNQGYFSLSTVLLEWDNYCAFLFLVCRTDSTDANHRLDAVQRQLRDLQGSRNNKLKLFGSWVPELLQRVDQAAQRGKFHHKPVGPIGKRNLF